MSIERESVSLLVAFFLGLACLLAGCDDAVPPGGPFVWIDAPADGLSAPPDQPVRIEGHAACQAGVARVEIWVNGELHLVEENPPAEGNLARFEQSWMPPGPGEYTVQAVAIGADGSGSEPDSARVHVGEAVAEVTPTPTTTPEEPDPPTPTSFRPATAVPPTRTPVPPTPTPIQGVEVSFWVERDSINAGECTVLHWDVEHATAVFLDGAGVVGHATRQVCPGSTKTYTLHVDAPSGDVDRSVTVKVKASTPVDKTAPPVPVPSEPPNGSAVPPHAKTKLEWSAVSDPSGIAEYQVQVQRPDANDNWQPLDGSPWGGLKKPEYELTTEAGWTYRWRVRAVDKAGNKSAYSNWFKFTVDLT